MDSSTLQRGKHTYFLFLLVFSLIHISGDHVFNKTNTLKLSILFTGLVLLVSYSIIIKEKFSNKYLLLLSLPVISTLPGFILHKGSYSYGFALEASSLILCSIWAYLIFQYKEVFYDYKRLLGLFIPITLFVVAIGILEKAGLSPLIRLSINPFEAAWVDLPVIFKGMPSRIESTFGNINYFAGYLIQLIPLFLALSLSIALNNHQKTKLTKYLAITALLFVALFLTGTRSALFATLISTAFLLCGWGLIQRRLNLKRLFFIGLMLIFITILIFLFHSQRIENLLDYSAWHSRVVPWQAAIESIKSSPLLGYGLGSSYELFFEFVSSEGRLALPNYSYNHVHFELLEIAQEGGFIGVLGYSLFWGYLIISLLKISFNRSLDKNERRIALAIISGFIAFHIHSCFSVAPRMIAVKITIYTLVGYALILIDKHHLQTSQANLSRTPIYLVSALLLIISIWLIPFLFIQYNYAKTLPLHSNETIKFLSKSSNDIYTLNRAAWLAKESGDRAWLTHSLERATNIFPRYRKLPYLSAHNALLNDNIGLSRELALSAQNHDKYLDELNELLAYIALTNNDKTLFIQQFSISLKSMLCRELKENCDSVPIKSIWGETHFPISLFESNNTETFILSNDFFEQIKLLNSDELAAITRQSPYFQPSFKDVPSLNPDEWKQLQQYITLSDFLANEQTAFNADLDKITSNSLLQQINQYTHITDTHKQFINASKQALLDIDSKLSQKMDIESFLKKRRIYLHIIIWLDAVKTYNSVLKN